MQKLGGEWGRSKVLALTMTIGILATLFFIGPIKAEIMNVFIGETDITIGEQLYFDVSMIIDKTDMMNVSSFIVDLAGPVSITCNFDTEGNKISSCVGIDVLKLSNDTMNFHDGYGYGYCSGYGSCCGVYGYGYNCNKTVNLTYQIIINTTLYPAGSYKTYFIALTNKGPIKTQGKNINFIENGTILESCSIRAKDGSLLVDGLDLDGNGKLNFNVPKSNAALGRGTLVAQKGNTRFTYKFRVEKILKNDEQKSLILVDGSYKVRRQDGINEESVLELDKQNNLININGTTIHVQGMEVNFLRGCEPI
ncbi:hypothetical protein COU57_03185 [Candidatus Pacearchaeota archaeon CG10_big_fil_rev_8_21_14_0_10_32_14]|nr:MAG: hypothetical protein COU57_03185 [Candidatus Pacearchaeota archaeon CG10_big_fil_rev_8_21_14_0_10_32_14]